VYRLYGAITMKNLNHLSVVVLEALMTDCLIRIESSTNDTYVKQQIQLFREVEQELIKRG
jgi:hypothetical protein